MADNDKDTKDTGSRQTEDAQPDYNKVIPQQPAGTTVGDGMSTDRDLGTVGGGTIPNGGDVGSGKPPGGMDTSSSTVAAGGTSGGGTVGAGSTTGRGGTTNEDITQNSGNTIDRHAHGNIGGRNPSAPQEPESAIGDRDPQKSLGKSQPDIADPMTSRDPKVGKDQSSYTENNP
ncbi:MAG: hypothetical protein ACR2H5_01370 [Ktedonobacteraceae bacterium]